MVPGQSVEQPSLWPPIRGMSTDLPRDQRLPAPPDETSGTVPPVGDPCSGSFHAISWATALSAASGTASFSNVPMIAIPVEMLFQPTAWAPTTGWSIPPIRPS